MKKQFNFITIIISTMLIVSCSENREYINESSVNETIAITNVLKFESNDQLQGFLDEIKLEKGLDLDSKFVLEKLDAKNILSKKQSSSLRSVEGANISQFISLLDSIKERDLAHLTVSDWELINSDPEHPIYVPDDYIIMDLYFASVLNNDREIQVNNTVYKYTEDGIYYVEAKDYLLLKDVKISNNENLVLDSRISLYVPIQEDMSTLRATTANPTLAGNSLTLANGVTIASSNIRDLNYKDRGDANLISNAWSSIWGRSVAAANQFNSSKRMVVTFYEQDYLIYKNIGTQAKMQKKVLGIWWNIDAQEIRIGWDAVEMKEQFPQPPFAAAPKPDFTPYYYPNTKPYEYPMPNWLQKDFPFSKNYTLISIPFMDYDIKIKSAHINKAYHSLIQFVDKNIKAYMKAYNLSKVPDKLGIITMSDNLVARYVIGPSEDSNTKKGSLEKKFLSEWFGGEYVIGYSTDPNNPTFNSKKFTFKIKGNKTSLGLGSVYGAVKYENKWLAARILKSE